MSTSAITPDQVYRALVAELDHPSAYITKDCSLNSVSVDGEIDCESIAEFLRNEQDQGKGVQKRHMKLPERIRFISRKVGAIQRKGVDEATGHPYARIEDVLEALNRLLDKQGLILTGSFVGPAGTTPLSKGCVRDVVLDWVLEDIRSGESRTWRIPGSGYDSDWDGTGIAKALTASRKSALIIIFNLQIVDVPEAQPKTREELQADADAVADKKIAAAEKRKATIAAKECVTVSWPEAQNGHKALFLGRVCIMEHHALEYMNRVGKFVDREQGWLVPRDTVPQVIEGLRHSGCNVLESDA